MKRSMQCRVLLAAMAIVLMTSSVCRAEESVFREIFMDAFYGALTGALVGGAVLAFTKKPGDHLDYMGYGAATGTLVGAAYGSFRAGRALAEVDHGRVRFAIPSVMPDFIDKTSTKQSSVLVTAELVRGRF